MQRLETQKITVPAKLHPGLLKAKDTLIAHFERNEKNCKTIALSSVRNKQKTLVEISTKVAAFDPTINMYCTTRHFEAESTITQDKTCFSKSTTSISTEKQHIIMTFEPITTTQQQLSTNNAKRSNNDKTLIR